MLMLASAFTRALRARVKQPRSFQGQWSSMSVVSVNRIQQYAHPLCTTIQSICARCEVKTWPFGQLTDTYTDGQPSTLYDELKQVAQLWLTCHLNACTNVFARGRHKTVTITYSQHLTLSMRGISSSYRVHISFFICYS